MLTTFRTLLCCEDRYITPKGFCEYEYPKKSHSILKSTIKERHRRPYVPQNKFHRAASQNNMQQILKLLSRKMFDKDHQDRKQRTALHFAANNGHLSIVQFFVLCGCNINVMDNKMMTPLIKAVQNVKKEVIHFLLQENADPNIKDIHGETALHHAILQDDPEIVNSLMDYGSNIETKSKNGFTPLMLALEKNKLQTAVLLITRGANVHVCDKYERTSLMYATKWDSEELIQLLLEKGANLHLKDKFGWEAWNYAFAGNRNVLYSLHEAIAIYPDPQKCTGEMENPPDEDQPRGGPAQEILDLCKDHADQPGVPMISDNLGLKDANSQTMPSSQGEGECLEAGPYNGEMENPPDEDQPRGGPAQEILDLCKDHADQPGVPMISDNLGLKDANRQTMPSSQGEGECLEAGPYNGEMENPPDEDQPRGGPAQEILDLCKYHADQPGVPMISDNLGLKDANSQTMPSSHGEGECLEAGPYNGEMENPPDEDQPRGGPAQEILDLYKDHADQPGVPMISDNLGLKDANSQTMPSSQGEGECFEAGPYNGEMENPPDEDQPRGGSAQEILDLCKDHADQPGVPMISDNLGLKDANSQTMPSSQGEGECLEAGPYNGEMENPPDEDQPRGGPAQEILDLYKDHADQPGVPMISDNLGLKDANRQTMPSSQGEGECLEAGPYNGEMENLPDEDQPRGGPAQEILDLCKDHADQPGVPMISDNLGLKDANRQTMPSSQGERECLEAGPYNVAMNKSPYVAQPRGRLAKKRTDLRDGHPDNPGDYMISDYIRLGDANRQTVTSSQAALNMLQTGPSDVAMNKSPYVAQPRGRLAKKRTDLRDGHPDNPGDYMISDYIRLGDATWQTVTSSQAALDMLQTGPSDVAMNKSPYVAQPRGRLAKKRTDLRDGHPDNPADYMISDYIRLGDANRQTVPSSQAVLDMLQTGPSDVAMNKSPYVAQPRGRLAKKRTDLRDGHPDNPGDYMISDYIRLGDANRQTVPSSQAVLDMLQTGPSDVAMNKSPYVAQPRGRLAKKRTDLRDGHPDNRGDYMISDYIRLGDATWQTVTSSQAVLDMLQTGPSDVAMNKSPYVAQPRGRLAKKRTDLRDGHPDNPADYMIRDHNGLRDTDKKTILLSWSALEYLQARPSDI